MDARLAVSLLGALEVKLDGELLGGFEYNKVRALLAYLSVEAQRVHTRASLCALLWPDLPENAARQNLSQALTQLRKVLGEKRAGQPFLLTSVDTVQMNPEASWAVDVRQFTGLIATAEAHPHRSWRLCPACAARLHQAVSLYRGDFLAFFFVSDSELFEEWALLMRERLRQLMLSALERLIEFHEWRGQYGAAVELARRYVELEPLRDGSHRELMRLLALSGQRASAQSQYETLQRTLSSQLGLEPERETAQLYERISQGGRVEELRRFPLPDHRLPSPPTAFVGREADLKAVEAFLEGPSRLLTITGAPGVGKSRLALEIAQRSRHNFEHGICFVELSALERADLVPLAVAQALGIKERAGQSLAETLGAYLKDRHALLLLDGFEYVPEAARFAASLLASCPELRLLVTSRAPLRVRGERQYVLQPLVEEEAVQLFAERARAVHPVFALTPENRQAVRALCRQLDNLPLGIELVAVRARTFSPEELLGQLYPRLEGLPRAPADLPERQSSLRCAIAWSYDRLNEAEQRLFAHLSVFSGGCTAEAAQAVLGRPPSGEGGSPGTVALLLEALVETSLVQSQVAAAGETRFSMLGTIHEFAAEQLQALGEGAEQAQRQHAAYFAGLAMQAYTRFNGPDGPRWVERITCEQDNLRAAFRTAGRHGEHVAALQLATGVWRYHWIRGLLREGLERLEHALQHVEDAPLDLQSNALRAAGTLAIGLNDYASARAWLERAVAVGRQLPDQSLAGAALNNLGFALMEQGELELAKQFLEESLAIARRGGSAYTIKFPLGMLGGLHIRLGQFAQARQYYEENLRLNRDCKDPEGTADSLRELARAVHALGEGETALQLGKEALELHESLNHQLGAGLDHLLLGELAVDRGEYDLALEHFRTCLTRWAERENRVNNAVVFDEIARTLALVGRPAEAVRLMSAAAAIRQSASVKLSSYEQSRWEGVLSSCRDSLDWEEFDRLWESGSALSDEQATALALELVSPP